jgi:hypothetical protein
MTIQKEISMAGLKEGEKLAEYSSYFWGETAIPKAAEVWLAKAPGASSRLKTWVAETWIKRITGGTAYTLIQEEISQTVKPDLPFIPEAYLVKSSNSLPKLMGASALLGLGLMPRTVTVSKPSVKSASKLTQISRLKIEPFSVVSVSAKLSPMQASVQEAKQVQSQTQIQGQVQRQAQSLTQLKMPTPQSYRQFYPDQEPKRKSERKRKSKGELSLVGRQKRFYPIADVKEFAKKMLG